MKIVRYEKKNNGKYLLHLEDNKNIILYENTIVKNNLLYKNEIDDELLKKLENDDAESLLYNKVIKYLSLRIRSVNEIREYLIRNGAISEVIDRIINKLIDQNILNDEVFTKAYVHDKFRFTNWGTQRIIQELKCQKIDDEVILKYVGMISEKEIDEKIEKQINKLIKNKKNLRNKIYNNLLGLGYSYDEIMRNLEKYTFQYIFLLFDNYIFR